MSKVLAWWIGWGAWVMAALFVVIFSALPMLQLAAFQMPGLDLAENDQAIWNVLHGRFLYSTIHHFSILAQHFSPLMAALSPLFLIWSDVRMLFLIQAVGLAVSGLFLYQIVRIKYPQIAPWFLLAFYLNPALHEIALVEFRRVTMAVPFLALALYALYVRKRGLMVLGLACAILCKEDVAVVVAMVGAYLMLFERDWQWGLPIFIVGAAWAVLVTFWVIPTLFPQGSGSSMYPQINYLGIAGSSQQEVLGNLLRDPFALVRRMVDSEARAALWRIFMPVGLVLPFLSPKWLIIYLPSMAFMLSAGAPGMHRLEDWYMAPVLPGLFATVAVSLMRFSYRWARWMVAGLLGTTLLGYALYGYAPLGGKYDPALYRITDRHRLAAQMVRQVPADARLAAQDPFLPHLSHREYIYLYPWIPLGKENVEYFLLARRMNPYPITLDQLNGHIDDMITDPAFVVEQEADGMYLFHQRGQPLPSFAVDRVIEGTMRLSRGEVAVKGADGFFDTLNLLPLNLQPGQEVRVSLYWEALAAPGAERTVSVRIADATGQLIAQYDSMPGGGRRPTSWWQKGWKLRDVYYLTVPPTVSPGSGHLDVLIYDSFSKQSVPFDDGSQVLQLCEVNLGGATP